MMDEAARQDTTLAATEAPLPQYFATDDEDFAPALEPVFRVRRTHDDEAGGSSLPGQREAESPLPPQITSAQVTQPDQLTSLIQTLASQTQVTLQVQQQMQTQFQQHQEAQQVILEGIRQQQEAQRQQMLQHQMMTTQMFTFISGCLGQLFQQSGM
jgi:DNA-binding transcriptional regulator YbjK